MGNKLMDSHQLAHFCHVNHSNRNGEATRKSQPDMSLLTLFEKSLKKSHFTTFITVSFTNFCDVKSEFLTNFGDF